MNGKARILSLVLAICLTLSACGSESGMRKEQPVLPDNTILPEAPLETPAVQPSTPEVPFVPDLSGQWSQVDGGENGYHQSAIISGTDIEIYLIDDETDTRMLYWAGTLKNPDIQGDIYTWVSKNDTRKTTRSFAASWDDTKEIRYENGQLIYAGSVGSADFEAHLEREDWADDLGPDEFYEEEYFSYSMAGVEFMIPSYFAVNEEDIYQASFAINASYKRGVLTLVQLPLALAEWEAEKENLVQTLPQALSDEKFELTQVEETFLAGLPGCFFIGDLAIGDNLTVPGYGYFVYNAECEKILMPFIVIRSDRDYTDYAKEIFGKARLAEEAAAPETPAQSEPPTQPEPPAAAGIRPEFKAAMDSYEAFFNEYIAFVKKYESAGSMEALSMLSDYMDYLTRMAETLESLEAVDDGELSDEEALYYLEVYTRIMNKLAEAGQ